MIENEFNKQLAQIENIFKEEIGNMHREIIDGSPVDSGRFKTSWQILDFDVKNLTFRMYNPSKYGLYLWRYAKSRQGWSPEGGDSIVRNTEENLIRRFNEL